VIQLPRKYHSNSIPKWKRLEKWSFISKPLLINRKLYREMRILEFVLDLEKRIQLEIMIWHNLAIKEINFIQKMV
jgi:hypothetical protein